MILRVIADFLVSRCKIHLDNDSAVLMLVGYSYEMQLLCLLLHSMKTINDRNLSLRRDIMEILK